MKKISVVIANYNGEKYLNTCLTSLEKTNYTNFDVWIIDDGSTDSSVSIIESFIKKAKLKIYLLQNKTNRGAAYSRNLAIKKCKSDILTFLDNDTEVTPDWLKYISITLDNSNVGACQSLLMDFEKRDTIQSAGIFLIPHVIWGISRFQGEKIDNIDLPDGDEICAISACLSVKKDVLKKVGGFDEKLAVSTEDLDFAHRIWILGNRIIFCKNSVVYHYTKKMSDRKNMNVNLTNQYFHITKNSIRTIIKNYSILYVLKYLPWCLAINLARALLVILRRKDFTSIIGFIKAMIWNTFYIKDTLYYRHTVQSKRVYSDSYIAPAIMLTDNLYSIYIKYYSQTKLI